MTVTANLRALGAILPFGRGDGSRLLFSGWNRAPLSPIVWDRINWQGTQQLYSTARTIINTYSEPLLADFATKSGTLLQGNLNDIGGLTKGGTFPAAVQQDYAYWSIPTLAATTQYTVSVFVKMADSSAPVPSLSATTGDFLLSLSSAWMTTGTWTVTPLGSGVYRCIWVGTSGAVASLYGGILRTATHSGRGFTVTGFNIQAGSVSGAYIHTTGSAVTVTDYTGTNPITLAQTTNPAVNQLVATNNGKGDDTTTAFAVTPSGTTPTLTALYKTDWQGKLKLYPTPRTNRALWSEQIENWSKIGGTITQNGATAPDGTVTMDLLKEDATTGVHEIYQGFTLPASVQRMQFFVKPAGRSTFRFYGDIGLSLVDFSVASGLVNAKNAAGTARTQIADMGGGIFRITVSWVNTTATSQNIQIRLTNGTTDSYTGDNTSGAYIWGLQQSDALPVTAIKIEAEGDSITQGYSPTPWPQVIQPDPGSTINNHAVSGTYTSDMLTRWASYKGGGANWFIMLGGINDITHDVAIATTKANLAQMWSEAKALGMSVIAMTTTPFKNNSYGLWTTGRQAVQDDLNAWIRSTADANGYLLVDVYNLLVDPVNANTLLPAYDSGDHLHPSQAGNIVIGNAINALLPKTDQTMSYIKTTNASASVTDYSLATNTATLSPAPAVGSLISWGGSYVGGLGVDEFVARQLIDQLGKVI